MRRLVILCLCALAGCGVLDDEGPAAPPRPDPRVYGPMQASPVERPAVPLPVLQPVSPEVASALADGAVGVVDYAGAVGVRPESLETSSDAVIEELKWTQWGADGASGSGSFRLLSCQPTCANGLVERVPASVTLSGVKKCDGRRYFSDAVVRVQLEGDAPAIYVRAPC